MTLLTDLLGPLGPALALLALGIAALAFTIPTLMKKQVDPLDKIRAARDAANGTAGSTRRKGSKAAARLDRYAQYLEPQDSKTMSSSRLQLLRAGYRSKNAVRIFYFSKLVLGLGLLVLAMLYVLLLTQVQGREMTTTSIALYTLLPAGAGYYLPQYWVTRRTETRKAEIISGFPDALDLMLVCIEAGQSLDQSINRVARELRTGYPALAEEFETISQEVKAGKERVRVLKDTSERIGVPDVSSFLTTLVQSATFGTSISDALRVYVAEMRDKRIMRAEEKANKLPTKLSLGTMVFTLPPLMVMLVGPSIYTIAMNLGKLGGF